MEYSSPTHGRLFRRRPLHRCGLAPHQAVQPQRRAASHRRTLPTWFAPSKAASPPLSAPQRIPFPSRNPPRSRRNPRRSQSPSRRLCRFSRHPIQCLRTHPSAPTRRLFQTSRLPHHRQSSPTRPSLVPPSEPRAPRVSLEERLGRNWLNKLGIITLVIGLALFLGYQLRTLGPLGKSLLGLALSAVLLAAASSSNAAKPTASSPAPRSAEAGPSPSSSPSPSTTSTPCRPCTRRRSISF